MHEVSLGHTLRDYLTSEQVEATTYEDLRQALARLLVEERGYPADRLTPRVEVSYLVNGARECRPLDLFAYGEAGEPLLAVIFCAGQVGSYERESVAAARLLSAPLVAVTDTRDAALIASATGDVLRRSLAALPPYAELPALAAGHPAKTLTPQARERESRILHAYTGFLKTCCTESCAVGEQKEEAGAAAPGPAQGSALDPPGR